MGVDYDTAKRKGKSRRKLRLEKVGKTKEGLIVVRGLFNYVESRGLPLDLLLNQLNRAGYVVDWLDYLESTERAGWKIETTFRHIEWGIKESVLVLKYSKQVIIRLRYYVWLTISSESTAGLQTKDVSLKNK